MTADDISRLTPLVEVAMELGGGAVGFDALGPLARR